MGRRRHRRAGHAVALLTAAGILYNHMVMSYGVLAEPELDRAFRALSDPTRRAILARLAEGDAGVLQVAAPFAMSQPAVTKHLRVLEAAGLISRHRRARQHMCHLEPQRLRQLSDWVGSYRQYWEESFDRLDQLLDELQGPDRQTATDKREGGRT